MDCLENESVCSVKKENNEGYYRIHTVWNNNGFRLNIASKNGAWTGEMTPENVRSISDELKRDPNDYLAECKEALTTDDGKKGYSYMVENGYFTWKKMIDEDSGIKIRMGSVMIRPVSYEETVQNIIEVALNCKKKLQEQLHSLAHDKDGELQRANELKNKLEELCKKKNLMENDLFSKFLLLLNAKKRKIQELESALLIAQKYSHGQEASGKINSSDKPLQEDTSVGDVYEAETEDEDDSKEISKPAVKHSVKKHHLGKKTASGLAKKKRNTKVKSQCLDVETSVESSRMQECNNQSSVESCEITSELVKKNSNIKSVNSKSIINVNSGFPLKKKNDILDYFFGSKED